MATVDGGELQAILANELSRRSGSRSRRMAEVLSEYVTLEVEGIDGMYLNI